MFIKFLIRKNLILPHSVELFHMIWAHRYLMIASILMALGVTIAEIFGIGMIVPLLGSINSDANAFGEVPFFSIFQQFFEGVDVNSRLRFIALALVSIGIIRSLMAYLSVIASTMLNIKIDRDLKGVAFRQLLSVEYQFISGHEISYLMQRLNSFASQTASVGIIFSDIIRNVFMMIAYSALSLLLSWQLTLSAAVMLFLMQRFVRIPLQKRIKIMGKELNIAVTNFSGVNLESIGGMKTIKIHKCEETIYGRFQEALKTMNSATWRLRKTESLMEPVFSGLLVVIISTLLVAASYILEDGNGSGIPLIILFLFILNRLAGQVISLNNARIRLSKASHAISEEFKFLDRSDKVYIQDGEDEFLKLDNQITIDNVYFRYKQSDNFSLNGISTTIPANNMTAIIGPSGSGKSTLINLICHLYDPDEGRIMIDDVDIREIDVKSWGKKIAVVTQDVFLFNDTVANNIRFIKPEATNQDVIDAAKLAHAHEFVEAMSAGYDTMVGDRGVLLSGGQQQRIALARAFLANPDILILDEATSNLDGQTELYIKDSVEKLRLNCTVIVVAHRLSTIMKADKIVVLDGGKVVEEGGCVDLISRKGNFWEMLKLQKLDLPEEDLEEAAKLAKN